MGKKRPRNSTEKNKADNAAKTATEELPAPVRQSEDEPEAKKSKWINKQRVLIFGCRGLGSRDRHLMEDLRTLMPHSKSDSKMHRKKEGSLFVVNEIAEMKNCNKCVLFECRRKKDLYLWMGNVARGPSAKFQVSGIISERGCLWLNSEFGYYCIFEINIFIQPGTKRAYNGRVENGRKLSSWFEATSFV